MRYKGQLLFALCLSALVCYSLGMFAGFTLLLVIGFGLELSAWTVFIKTKIRRTEASSCR